MTLHLVCCLTREYFRHARPCLRSLARVRAARTWCVAHGWAPAPALAEDHAPTAFRALPRQPTESCGIIQHGPWLDALPELAASDLVVLVDADLVVQRDFWPDELQRLAGYDDRTLGAAPNAGPGDTLAAEYRRLGLDPATLPADLGAAPCYNCGVLLARVATWRLIRQTYEQLCPAYYQQTTHPARNQWLLGAVFRRLQLRVDVLGPELHSHGHFACPPPGVTFAADGTALAGDGRPVLFRHRF